LALALADAVAKPRASTGTNAAGTNAAGTNAAGTNAAGTDAAGTTAYAGAGADGDAIRIGVSGQWRRTADAVLAQPISNL
jgi:hypothetical protein